MSVSVPVPTHQQIALIGAGPSGLAGARNDVGRWKGKLSVRSGTARIAIVPGWDDDVPLAEGLAPFAGAQVQVIIPEAVADERGSER